MKTCSPRNPTRGKAGRSESLEPEPITLDKLGMLFVICLRYLSGVRLRDGGQAAVPTYTKHEPYSERADRQGVPDCSGNRDSAPKRRGVVTLFVIARLVHEPGSQNATAVDHGPLGVQHGGWDGRDCSKREHGPECGPKKPPWKRWRSGWADARCAEMPAPPA